MSIMSNRIYQVDAFCKDLFSGNPAAVCPLEYWLEDQTMKNIAAENNLAETTFYVKEKDGFRIRWFTPEMEVDLCGHATLAAAHVLFSHEGFSDNTISFASCSGELKVSKKGDQLTLDFPADHIKQVEVPLICCNGSLQSQSKHTKADLTICLFLGQKPRSLAFAPI